MSFLSLRIYPLLRYEDIKANLALKLLYFMLKLQNQEPIMRLKLAIQKSGRLSKDCIELLRSCGLKFNINENLIAFCTNFPIDILRIRDDDIPGLIFDGIIDLGIVGENVLKEHVLKDAKNDFIMLKRLDFGHCRLSLALPDEVEYDSIKDFDGLRIATSYPYILKDFMTKNNIKYSTCSLTGSVEIAPKAGLSEAICDLVSSGATLSANGLKEVATIMHSSAMLVQKSSKISPELVTIIDRLLLRIEGLTQAKESKYIMLHAPKDRLDAILKLLPGMEKPTILPLANDSSKVALHMVSLEKLFWETMEELKNIGASSILVLPIEKMMK